MTPTELRHRAMRLIERLAIEPRPRCCRDALLAAADAVRAMEITDAPTPAEQVRRRDVIARSIERYARLLQRGHEVRSVVVALRQLAMQVRRLVLAPEAPPAAAETQRDPAGAAAPPPPSWRPDGRYSFLDADTAIEELGGQRRGSR